VDKPAPSCRDKAFLGIYTLFIFVLSSFPLKSDLLASLMPCIDKIFHGVLYFGLGIISARLFSQKFVRKTLYFFSALLYSVTVAMSDELYQGLLVYRTKDSADLAADFLGVITGILIYVMVKKIQERRESKQPNRNFAQ